jgi:DNA-directed RNA polymerase specialized sigma24 family protein
MAQVPANFGRLLGFLRRQSQLRKHAEELIQEVSLDLLPVSGQLVNPGPSPDVMVEIQQDLSEIVQILESSSRHTRDIYLAHRAGYSYDEIADLTGLAHVAIKRHIARGLLAIMEHRAPGAR